MHRSVASWRSGNDVGRINEVTIRRARLVPGWVTRVGPRKHMLHGGAHWRNLANRSEPSVRGCDAAFLSNYFDHLLLGRIAVLRTHLRPIVTRRK